MIEEGDITKKTILPTRTWLQIIGALLFFAISSTFTLTLIYSEFLLNGEQMVKLEELHNKDIETLKEDITNTNSRIDKISGRNKDAIDKNSQEIRDLKQPNSDKPKN